MIKVSFEKLPGTACFAPYINVTISRLDGKQETKQTFKARLDTGADITCVPGHVAKSLMPLLLGRKLLLRGYDGKIKRSQTHRIKIHIHHNDKTVKTVTPSRGVLLTDAGVGLIGMDILNNFYLAIDPVKQTATLAATGPIMQAASLAELEQEEGKREQKALTPLRGYGIILWKHLTTFACSLQVKKTGPKR